MGDGGQEEQTGRQMTERHHPISERKDPMTRRLLLALVSPLLLAAATFTTPVTGTHAASVNSSLPRYCRYPTMPPCHVPPSSPSAPQQ